MIYFAHFLCHQFSPTESKLRRLFMCDLNTGTVSMNGAWDEFDSIVGDWEWRFNGEVILSHNSKVSCGVGNLLKVQTKQLWMIFIRSVRVELTWILRDLERELEELHSWLLLQEIKDILTPSSPNSRRLPTCSRFLHRGQCQVPLCEHLAHGFFLPFFRWKK